MGLNDNTLNHSMCVISYTNTVRRLCYKILVIKRTLDYKAALTNDFIYILKRDLVPAFAVFIDSKTPITTKLYITF